jgi:hypothetical protein
MQVLGFGYIKLHLYLKLNERMPVVINARAVLAAGNLKLNNHDRLDYCQDNLNGFKWIMPLNGYCREYEARHSHDCTV